MKPASMLLTILTALATSILASSAREPPTAVTVTFEVLSQRAETPRLSGTVVVRSSDSDEEKRSMVIGLEPLTIRGKVGTTRRVELVAPGWWMDPLDVTIAASHKTIPLRAWPLATLFGKLNDGAASQMPAFLKLVVESPPWRRTENAIRTGTEFRCPVKAGGEWSCSVPAADLDLAVVIAGYIPEYRWNLKPAPGGKLDLGTAKLREGGSVVAWLSPDLIKSKKTVRATIRRPTPPDPSPAAQRLARPLAEAAFDAQGFVQLAPVPAGSYVLEVSATGFATTRIFPLGVVENRETILRRSVELGLPIKVAIRLEPGLDPLGVPWTAIVRRASSFGGAYEPAPVFNGAVAGTGDLTIAGQSPGRFQVSVSDRSGNRVAEEEFEARSNGDARVTVSIPVVRVQGEIYAGKSPLAATLMFGGVHGVTRIGMTSDERGRFTGWVPREGAWIVDVRSRDGNVSTVMKTTVQNGQELRINVPSTRVAGIVVNGQGPAAKARVLMTAKGLVHSTLTDAEGSFSFSGAVPGRYTLVASSRSGEMSSSVTVELPTENTERAGVRLELRSPGSINGRVMGNGQPIVAAHVHVFAADVGGAVVTDVGGWFTAKVPSHAKTAVFVVQAPGRVFTVFNRSLDDDVTLDVEANGGTLQLVLPTQLAGLRLLQNGTRVPLPLALGWAQTQGLAVRQGAPVTIPNIAAAQYKLCEVSDSGRERCVQGRLLPGATLSLDITE